MSEKLVQAMTNVKGYFNPNSYRVNVSISELGIAVQLEPMEFILDRLSGKKINDPILDKYVGHKMLSPEIAAQPVPVIGIPKIPAPVQSLHVINQGVRGADGNWQAAPPNTKPPESMVSAPATVSRPSTVGMSMEEARRRGFVGKTRLVSDDYGAPETDGAPQRGDGIPPIKYAMESQAPLARPGALPPELVEQVRPEAAALVAGLQKAAEANPEVPNLGRKAAEQAIEAQQGKSGVQAFRKDVKTIRAKAKTPAALIPPPPASAPASTAANPAPAPAPAITGHPGPRRRRVGQVVVPPAQAAPAPVLAEPVVESPLMGGRPASLPQPLLEGDGAEPGPKASPVKPAAIVAESPAPGEVAASSGEDWTCGGCGQKFQYRSYLARHVSRVHKDRMSELMPPAQ